MNNETIANILATLADLTKRLADMEEATKYHADLLDQLVEDGKLDNEEYTTLNSR